MPGVAVIEDDVQVGQLQAWSGSIAPSGRAPYEPQAGLPTVVTLMFSRSGRPTDDA